MSTTAPATPARKGTTYRSFTAPIKSGVASRTQPTTAEIGAADGIETLYVHPDAKIVKFSSGAGSRPGSSNGGVGAQVGGGTLPWATITEQTLAAGPLEIYRVPGSVSFLHSGSLLHAIMPRSNCWCVDGVSKFAMRVLTDTYYRIELPGESQEEMDKVEAFKEILKKVLFYERTPCPFARTFTVDLPEEQPVRKKRRSTHGPAKKWKLESAYSWRPEDGREPLQQSTSEEDGESGSMTDEEEEDVPETPSSAEDVSEASDLTDRIKELSVQATRFKTPPGPSVRDRVRGISMRSVTAPVQLTTQMVSPSPLKTSYPAAVEPNENRTYQAIPTDMPPSPPDSSAGFENSEVVHDHTSASTLRHSEVTRASRSLALALNESNSSGLSAAEVSEPDEEGTIFPSEPTMLPAEPIDQPKEAVEGSILASNHEAFLARVQTETSPHEPEVAAVEPEARDYNEWMEVDPTLANSSVTDPPPSKPLPRDTPSIDPFAQIQARIQARRSIGSTTTSFVPPDRSPTRQSSFSTASSTRSSLSRHSNGPQQSQQAVATALVRKACAAFLGPPAHLVVLMLKIAARFARGVFPQSLIFNNPIGSVRRVPGSFDLDDSDCLNSEDEMELEGDDLDDFGVPIESPVRLAAGLRERRV